MQTGITISGEHLGIGQKLMLAAGLLAASGFAFVSIASNLRFGISLASTPFDRIIYGALSIAADLMKIALPLVVAILWRKRERIFALAGAVFWIGAVAFSICAAIGFAASTRDQTVATTENLIEARKAWEAKITRVEGRLDLLGVHRPTNIVQAEIDALLRTPGTDGCKVVNGPITQDICPKVRSAAARTCRFASHGADGSRSGSGSASAIGNTCNRASRGSAIRSIEPTDQNW